MHNLSISIKEHIETSYWLNLLKDSNYIDEEQFKVLSGKCLEVTRILNSIILITKQRYFKDTKSYS